MARPERKSKLDFIDYVFAGTVIPVSTMNGGFGYDALHKMLTGGEFSTSGALMGDIAGMAVAFSFVMGKHMMQGHFKKPV